jgi:hypothetical protein
MPIISGSRSRIGDAEIVWKTNGNAVVTFDDGVVREISRHAIRAEGVWNPDPMERRSPEERANRLTIDFARRFR